jgi:uncharacterized protein (TIGR02246 family)
MSGDGARDLDEDSVRAVEEEYDRAWGAGDLDALMACLTVDAVLVSPRGQIAIGEEAIRDLLGTFLAGEARASRHQSTVDRIAFLGDDVAVVDAHATIATGASTSLLEHPFTDILVRGESGWRIAHIRAYHFEPDT